MSIVEIFDSRGNLLRSIGGFGSEDGQFNRPLAVAVDKNTGDIVVSDGGNGRIEVFDSEGNFLRKFPGGGTGLAVDASGNIYMASAFAYSMPVVDSQGNFITRIESFSTDRGAFMPQGVAVDASGNIVVADTNNDSIRVFVP